MHPLFPYVHCTYTRSLQTPLYTRNGLYFMKLRQNWYSPLLYPECSFFRSTKCFFDIDLVFYSRTRCLGNGYLSGLWNFMSWWCILYLLSTTVLCFSRPVIGKQSLRGCYQQASRIACLVSSACFPQQFGSFLEFNFLNDRFSLDTEMMVCFSRPCEANLNKGGRDGIRNTYLLIAMHLDSHMGSDSSFVLLNSLNTMNYLDPSSTCTRCTHTRSLRNPLYASCTLRNYARIGYTLH